LGYDELLPEHAVRMLLRLLRLRVLLLHLYGSGLWHWEAGDLEIESSQGFTEPAARDELAGGFFAFGALSSGLDIQERFFGSRRSGALRMTRGESKEKSGDFHGFSGE